MDILKNYECDGQMDIFEYEKSRAGQMTTLETRAESNEQVDRQKRYSQIVECLKTSSANNHGERMGMTAKEIAVMMMNKGYIPTAERNYTAPRLTEMSISGIVEPIGKKKCNWTGHKVTVYALREA